MAIAPGAKLTYAKAYMSFGFREIWFPIDTRLLLSSLPESGFSFTEPERIGPMPFRGRLSIRGEDLGRKGDFHLAIDTDRQHVGIDGPDPVSVLRELQELEQFIERRLSFKVENRAAFYEFLTDGYISVEKNARELFQEATLGPRFLEKIQDALDEPTELFGIRFVPRREKINDPDWFEIDLHPPLLSERPMSCEFSVIYRKPQREKVVKFAQEVPDILSKLIKCLEG